MKDIFSTVLLLLVIAQISSAQNLQFGIKAGVNFATLSGDVSDANSRTALHFGTMLEIPFSSVLSVQPELLYSGQGFKADGDTVKIDYLNIPILGKYYLAEGLSIEAGPQFGFLLSATSEIDDEGDIKDELRSIDFGLNFGMGYKTDTGLCFGLCYYAGLANLENYVDDFLNDYTIRNSVFQISVGYLF